MTSLGMGVMLSILEGDRGTAEAVASAIGKMIASVALPKDDGGITILFTDGAKLRIWDDGQSCCEHRYVTCDDDLSGYVGALIASIEERDAADVQDENGECHEQRFVVIATTLGSITICTHNEHNGYYGGFSLRAAVS
jgi:hypothetical protein